MKRFFKKVSLVLVALCLIIGSTLSSSAAMVGLSGAYTFDDQRTLTTGTGTTTSCYMYVCYTGAYNEYDDDDGYFVMRAETRGGSTSTHLTSVCMEMDCDSTGVNKQVDKNSETEGSRYLEGYIRAERGEVYSGNGTIQVYIDATAGGQSWEEHFVYRLSCNDVGWYYVSQWGN
jgi:hypothetical protein